MTACADITNNRIPCGVGSECALLFVWSSQSLKKLWAGESKREQEGVRATGSYFLPVLFLHALLLLGDSIA